MKKLLPSDPSWHILAAAAGLLLAALLFGCSTDREQAQFACSNFCFKVEITEGQTTYFDTRKTTPNVNFDKLHCTCD